MHRRSSSTCHQHRDAITTRSRAGQGDVASPHSNQEFARIPLQVLRAAGLWHSRWNPNVMAQRGVGRAVGKFNLPCSKELCAVGLAALGQEFPWAGSWHAGGFPLPSLWSPRAPPESSAPSEKARASRRGDGQPFCPSWLLLRVIRQGQCMIRMHLLSIKTGSPFPSWSLWWFCSHLCCNMQGEAPNCQAL